jgi:DNA-binding FadR family transcriptional regulator
VPPSTSNAAIDLDLRFHQALANCTANPLLIGLEGAMDSAYRQFRERSIEDVTPHDALRGLGELTAAVRARDRSAARRAMDRHLSYSDEFFGAHAEPADKPPVAKADPPA